MLRQIEDLRPPTSTTVVFETKDHSVQCSTMLVYILPKHIWKDVPADETKTFKNSPARRLWSCPRPAVEWKEGQSVRLEANPDCLPGANSPHRPDHLCSPTLRQDDTMVQAPERPMRLHPGDPHQPLQVAREPGGSRPLGSQPRVHRARLQPLRALPGGDRGVRRPRSAPGISPCSTPWCERPSTGPSREELTQNLAGRHPGSTLGPPGSGQVSPGAG